MCLGNIQKGLPLITIQKTVSNGYVNDFFVDFSIIDTNNIISIHKYFKKKQDIKNLFTVSVNLCSRCCNTTGDLYARVCVLCQVKNMNVKVSDLMPGGNEARFLVQVWIG